ncbi:MAG: PP2C family protein-serine/threonine phosphatase [Bryobacteraceae bacterium]|nr:PP2C family protein-serine/threonine phosphatase [Bryobacteraceae bacterium]
MKLNGIRYPWLKASLGVGAGLALLLLVNSVSNYYYLAPRVAADATGRQLSQQASMLDRQAGRGGAPLQSIIAEFFDARRDRLAWIRVLDREGKVAAQIGEPVAPAFAPDRIRGLMRARKPVAAVHHNSTGMLVVQVLPFRFQAKPGENAFYHLEIAGYADESVYWPLRRNLLINSSAALALLGSLIVIALRFRAYVRGQRLQEQLELARQVQQGLLPSAGSIPAGLDLAAGSLAAHEVGGDFYDVLTVDGGRPALVLGDVSGKGVPAALLMGVIHGAVRSSRWAETGAGHEELGLQLNRLLYERSSQEKFATMFWCDYDLMTGRLRYVNAGHCPPLLIHGSTVSRLGDGGPVLGLLPYARYQRGLATLESDDLLVLYSDGVVEASNATGEEFGEHRLLETIMANRDRDAEKIRRSVVEAVRSFTGTSELEDDLTLVVFRTPARAAKVEPLQELVSSAA